ncbi:hypothetical protein Nmel_003049 [Mimus melanotis]
MPGTSSADRHMRVCSHPCISAASIAFAVTPACSCGELHKCGCNPKIRGVSPEGFQWSGCSDNLSYGITFSQAFMDSPEKSCVVSSRALMNLHNNEAERKALQAHMQVEHQCHGVWGSCEVCTCWKVIPPFCHEKSEGAAELYPTRVGSCKLLVPKSSRFKPCTLTTWSTCEPAQSSVAGTLGMTSWAPLGASAAGPGWPWPARSCCAVQGCHTARAERCSTAAASSAGAAPFSAGSAGPSWSCTGATEGLQSAGQVPWGAISSCVLPT